ncbi:MAG: hypothetical protein AAF802_27925, partial [Planctomycetota bacterium]
LLASSLLAGAAAATVVSSTGCSLVTNAYRQARKSECLDEFMIAHRNRTFALKAWYRERDCFANKPYLSEFKAGFLAGYMEIAEGGDGCSPCTAPSQYWGWRYQSPDGQSAIDAWFAGYPLGVKAAEMDGVGYWGYTHQANNAVPAKTSETPAEAKTPAPAEPRTPIYGPDGKLIPPGQEMREYIVPGTERVVPPSELESLRFDPGAEMLETPAVSDGADVGGQKKFEMITSDDSRKTQAFDDAASLVPAAQVVSESETYSLDDLGKFDDLGDDAIEDIFGSVEMMDASASSGPASKASVSGEGLILPATGSEAKTADAENGIPFKFE